MGVAVPVESAAAEAAIGYATARCDETPVRAARDSAANRDRNRSGAQDPSIPRRSPRYPSWSGGHGASVSCSLWLFFVCRIEFVAGNLVRRTGVTQEKRECFAADAARMIRRSIVLKKMRALPRSSRTRV